MKKTAFLSLVCIVFACKVVAQNPDSLWTAKIGSGAPITWQSVASDGTPVVGTHFSSHPDARQTEIVGLDPQSGTIKWKYPSVKLDPKKMSVIDGITNVPNTPYISLNYSNPKDALVLIDPSDGHILLDITKEQITGLEGYGLLLESGHLWVSGTVNGDRSISLFDLRDGKKLWTNTEFLKERNKAASKLNKFNALSGGLGGGTVDVQPVRILGQPINHGENAMIIATRNGIFHVQLATGNVDWEAEIPDPNKGKAIKTEVDPNFAKLVNGPGENFYVIKAAFMIACRYADGKPAWSNVVKTSGPIDEIIYDVKGMILCPGNANAKGMFSSGYLKLVNPQTGEEYWGDGIKFSGGTIKDYLYTSKGLALVMENSSSGKNMINFLDVDAGKFTLAKPVNVDGIVEYIELTPKGLLYKSNNEVNILGLETDKQLLGLPKSKGDASILTLNSGDMFYYYSDDEGKIYQINKTEGSSKLLNKGKIDFQGKEKPMFMEQRTEGVAVFSQQNATLITPSGDAKYSVYKPGVRTFFSTLDALNTKSALASDVLNLNTGTSAAAEIQTPAQRNAYSRYNQAYGKFGKPTFVTSMQQFSKVTNRLKASAQGNDLIFMMTKVDDRSSLVGISKDTGEVTSTVKLAKRDNEPLYVVDVPSGMLFYAPRGTNIIGWNKDGSSVSCFKTGGR